MKSFPAYYSSPAYRALRRHLLASGTAAALFTGAAAFAADASWSIGTGGGNWTQDSAWTPAAAPGLTSGNTTSTDTATFDSSTRTILSTIAVDAGRNIGNITFNTTNSFGYTLSGGSLVLSSGGTILATGNGTGQNTINPPMTLQGNYTLTANSNLQFNSSNTSFTTAPNLGNVVMNVGGSWAGGTVLSAGVISQGTGSTLSIIKTGTSVWQFNGNNTFSGGVTVKQGNAGYGLNGGFGTGAVTLGDTSGSNNATLSFGSNTSLPNAITVQAGTSGVLSFQRGGGFGGSTISGVVTLANNLTVSQIANNSHPLTLSGNITGAGNLSIKALLGNGTTTLSGASINFTGALSNEGVSASPTVISGAIGSNVSSVTQNSTVSSLTLSGTNTYTGPTTISAGTLSLGNGGSTGSISPSSTITNAGTLRINRNNAVTQGTDFSGAGLTGTGGFTQAGTGTTTLNTANTYAGPTTVSAGILTFLNTSAKPSGSAVTVAAAGTIGLGVGAVSGDYSSADVDAAFANTLAGFTLDPSSGIALDTTAGNFVYATSQSNARTLTKLGANSLTLTGSNTYGSTIIRAGTLILGNSTNTLSDTGAITISGGTLDLGANSDTVGAVTLTSGSIIGTTGVLTASSYAIQAGTVSAALGGSGAVTKSTTGTAILSNVNSYSGGTTITAGLINFSNLSSFGTGGITLNGGGVQWAASYTGGDLSTRTLTLSGAGTLDTNGNNVTLANAIGNSGAGSLTKNGTGTLTLLGTNTYTGITTLGNGTLQVSSIGNFNNAGSSLGTASLGTLTNTAPATNTATSTNSLQFINDAAGATKTLSYIGAGETSNRAIYIRSQQADAIIAANGEGALVLTGPITSYIPNNTTTINTSFVFSGNNTSDNTFSSNFAEFSAGQPASSINLYKRGTGTWLLSGNKNYRGVTFVEEGTLKFDSIAIAGTNSALGFGNQRRIGGTSPVAVPYGIVLGAASTAGTLDYVGTTAGTTNRVIGLNGNGTLSNSAALEASTLTFTGGISSLTSGAKTLTLGGANTGSNTFGGVIADGSGTVSLNKIGAGYWTLTNTNTYTGPTSIQLGTLALAGSGSLSAAPLTLATGSTLDISAISAAGYTIANGLSGSGTINATGKPLTISGAYDPGAISITGDVTFGGSAASTFLASTVPGVSSATTVTGTVLNAGTLVINPAPAFTLAGNQSFTFVTAGSGITPGYSGVTVNGVPLANSSGVWAAVSGNLSYTYTESNATLTLAPSVVLTALQSWRQTNFGTTDNTGTASDTADFDSDGLSNLLEYATGTNPTLAGGTAGYSVAPSGNVLALTYQRIADQSLTYTVEGSSDLTGAWSTVAVSGNPSSGASNVAGNVTITDTVPFTSGKRFLRLKVTY